VGNLVCPAIYDLGQAANVVVLSVTEGEDKPLKYPVMFKAADLVLLTKCDLVPHLEVDPRLVEEALARVMPQPLMLKLSARTGEGVDRWVAWLEERRAPLARSREAALAGGHAHGHVHAASAEGGGERHSH
jgi:hydrogenase nickel incorporation protein HypB